MKHWFIYFVFLSTLILCTHLNAQINPLWDELIIGNLANEDTIFVTVKPVGFIFNGDKMYSARTKIRVDSNHIFGGHKTLISSTVDSIRTFRLNHDIIPPNTADSNIGYGKYQVDFIHGFWGDSGYKYTIIDSLTIDYSDSDYPYGPSSNWPDFTNDFLIYYYAVDSIFVEFHGGSKIKLDTTNREFQMWNQVGKGNFKTQNKSGFKSDSLYVNYPLKSENYSGITHINPSSCYVNFKIQNQNVSISSNDSLKFLNSKLEIGNNITFGISSSNKLTISGAQSGLKCNKGSVLNFPQNFNLIITGGILKADSSTFQSASVWNGIKLENTGTDTIINCTFNNAKTAVTVTNNSNTIYNEKIITNNTFNVPSGGNHFGINLNDCYNLNLSNNVFNLPASSGYNYIGALLKHGQTGIGVIEVSGEGQGGGEAEGIHVLNVVNNTFNDGTASLIITNYTSNLLQYYIYNNSFTGSNAANMILTKVVGTVKKNNLESGLGGGAFV